ncbi:piRNA biogenesis protein EXD1 [Mastacembelus armatus]|uniref:piRNA biogenesis protein EXD1 n=1 Tax=Mastacembelus armatus TaxID=205130 RepID=UPI000E458F68|nr:piRNA biogenesis protein EXD1 [Mastacembelus armatus]
MVVDDVKFMSILKGKRIKLTLKSSSFFGVVQRINHDKSLILTDVVSASGCKYPGSKVFFGHEVVNVEFASGGKTDNGDIHANTTGDDMNVKNSQVNKKSFLFQETLTIFDDKEGCLSFVVIDDFHEKFGPAVMHIKKQHVIGVGAEGVELFNHGRLCWLQIALKNKVYLFDILLLGVQAFKNGLSMILESKHILKVIHDCRAITGCLISQFGVKLTNVFDTQVADVMCFYSETGGFLPNRVSTLKEVLKSHLKVPSSQLLALQMKSQLIKEEREMWYKRPCPVPMLKMMVLSVVHLQPLRLALLDTLMTDYITLVDSYLSSCYYEPGELDHISMESMLELPRELKQLKQMYCERQKQAIDLYPVTEQGLLARFNPRTQPPSQTSPVSLTQGNCVESPPSAQVDVLSCQSPTSPLKSTDASSAQSVEVNISPDSPAQASVPETVPDLRKQMSPASNLPVGVGRGCRELLMDTISRGRSLGTEQSVLSALPAMGRGFPLQIPPAQILQEYTGDMKTPGRMKATPSCPNLTSSETAISQSGTGADDPLNDISVLRGEHFTPTPQSLLSSLSQSFRSFRF